MLLLPKALSNTLAVIFFSRNAVSRFCWRLPAAHFGIASWHPSLWSIPSSCHQHWAGLLWRGWLQARPDSYKESEMSFGWLSGALLCHCWLSELRPEQRQMSSVLFPCCWRIPTRLNISIYLLRYWLLYTHDFKYWNSARSHRQRYYRVVHIGYRGYCNFKPAALVDNSYLYYRNQHRISLCIYFSLQWDNLHDNNWPHTLMCRSEYP